MNKSRIWSVFCVLWGVSGLAGIAVDATTGWGVVDRGGHAFATKIESDAAAYPGLTLHGPVSVTAQTWLKDTATHAQTLALAPDVGDLATVSITGSGSLANSTAGRRGLFFVGENGGWGSITLKAKDLKFYELRVCEKAAVPDADQDGNAPVLLTLGVGGSAPATHMHFISNLSTKPVRILFDGGYFTHCDGAGGAWFYPTTGDIVLEGANGHPIWFQSGGHSLDALGIGAGKVIAKGDVDFVWDASNNDGNGGRMRLAAANSCRFEMTYTGKTILSGANFRTDKDTGKVIPPLAALELNGIPSWFPQGADTDEIELRSRYADYPTWLDLVATTQAVNGIVAVRNVTKDYPGIDWGVVSNTGTKASALVLGRWRDGRLANVAVRGKGPLVTRQVGHRIAVTNADIADYRLEAGELVVGTNVTFGGLALAADAVLTADGTDLELDAARVTDGGARFRAVNGGRITWRAGETVELLAGVRQVTGGATNEVTTVAYRDGIVLEKTGATFVTCPVPAGAKLAGVTVSGGTLRFGGAPCADSYWRFTAKGAKETRTVQFPDFVTTATLGIGTIGLFDSTGLNVNYGLKARPSGMLPSALQVGDVASERPYFPTGHQSFVDKYGTSYGDNPLVSGASCDSIASGFDSYSPSNTYDTVDIATWWGGVVFTNQELHADDPSTWERISWRNRAGTAPVVSYALAPLINVGQTRLQVTDWMLESSADGVNWTFRDERRGQTDYDAATGAASVKGGVSGRYTYNGHRPYLLSGLADSWRVTDLGTFSVAAGAVLDLDEIPDDNIAIASIEVDLAAGGGRITKFRPAANGELRLVHANREDFVGPNRKAAVDVPLTIGRTIESERMSGWSLVVDGERIDDVRIGVSPACGRLRAYPGLAAEAEIVTLDASQAIVLDAATVGTKLPLVRSAGIVSVPPKGFLSLTGWTGPDALPADGFVLAEAAGFDLPDDFGGWTFEPDDGERALTFSVEGRQLKLRIEPVAFVNLVVGPQCSFSGCGGVTILPRLTYNGGKTVYDMSDGTRAADGTLVYKMTGTDVPTVDCTLSLRQKDAETVTMRYGFTPQTDMTADTMMVLALVPNEVAASCTRDGKSESLPLNASEYGGNRSCRDVAFFDAGGTCRIRFVQPEARSVALWTQGNSTRANFYCPTAGAQQLTAGREYVIEFDVSADRPVRTFARGLQIEANPQWMASDTVRRIAAGSALDFTRMRSTGCEPAGAHGRVVRVGDHFEFTDLPGVRQRFFGTNISEFPADPEEAEACAADLARHGYNVLRLHMFEGRLVAGTDDDSKCTLNPDALDRFDRFVAACVAHGIYLSTDIYVNRPPTWESLGYTHRTGTMEMNDFKFLLYGSDAALENLKTFTRRLYTHVNPYTGRSFVEEPALMNLSTVNEGGLMLNPQDACALIPELEGLWKAWLAQKKAENPTAYAAVTEAVPSAFGETANGRAFAVFAADRQRLLYTRLRDFVHDELKCPVPMTANLNADFRSASFELVRGELNDFVDAHFYIDHPGYYDGHDNKLPYKLTSGNMNPMRTADLGAQMVVRHRHLDKPFCVTEYNYVPPCAWRSCGGLLTGAMAALQGWDGLMRFAWGSPTLSAENPSQKKLANFALATDPINLMSEYAAATLYARGDIGELSRRYVVNLPKERIDRPAEGVTKKLNDMACRWAAWYAKTGVVISNAAPAGAVSAGAWPDPVAFDRARVLADLGLVESGGRLPPAGDGAVTIGEGRFLLDTPRTVGAFLENGAVQVGTLAVDVGNMPATVWASSLDGEPIGRSSSLVLGHLTDLQNTGLTYVDSTKRTMTGWGSLPLLIRVARAEVALTVGKGNFAVYALALDGSRKARVPARKAGDVISFTVDVAGWGDTATCMYEIVRNGFRFLLK